MTGVLLSKTNQMRLPLLLLDNCGLICYGKRSAIDYNSCFLGYVQLRTASSTCNLFVVILNKVNRCQAGVWQMSGSHKICHLLISLWDWKPFQSCFKYVVDVIFFIGCMNFRHWVYWNKNPATWHEKWNSVKTFHSVKQLTLEGSKFVSNYR